MSSRRATPSAVGAVRRLTTRLAGRVVRRLRAEVDSRRWARTLRAADLVDSDYVAAQLGRTVSARRAVALYSRRGYRTGLRLNPLFVDVAVGDHLPGLFIVPALVAYVTHDPTGVQVSPLWDAAAYLRRHPERAGEPGGAVGAAWRRRLVEPLPLGPDPSGGHELAPVLTAAVAAAADAAAGREASLGAAPPSGGVELLLAIGARERDFDETLVEAAEFAASGHAVGIALTAADAEVWAQVAMLARCAPRTRAVLRPGTSTARALDELRTSSGADVIVLRGPNLAVGPEAMAALAAHASSGRVVAPVWLDHDGTIAAAGAAREGRILAGHPSEDVAGLGTGDTVVVPALAGDVVASPARLLRSLSGASELARAIEVDAALAGSTKEVRTDLVARARTPVPTDASPPVAESSRELLENAGWVIARGGGAPRLRRPARWKTLPDGTRVPVLRWALRTAAPAGPRGEWWGDTHFARGLAAALRRLGQEVVVDAYPARHRASASLDDVTLALRGPEHLEPAETGTSLAWIISHPDEITREGLTGFDLVFAASSTWARDAGRLFGRDVRPLLQCTDATRFRPTGLTREDRIVFVGTARGIFRPSVVAPVRAGIPVDVYGPDWRSWIPARAIAGTGIPNDELPSVYETAGVVLNDHWPAMQQRGFIANRPYDVVAAGGRVISDHVEGIEELFGGAVVTYRHVDELIALLRDDLDRLFPDEERLSAISSEVRALHSFDARARTLLDAVLEMR